MSTHSTATFSTLTTEADPTKPAGVIKIRMYSKQNTSNSRGLSKRTRNDSLCHWSSVISRDCLCNAIPFVHGTAGGKFSSTPRTTL